MYRVSEGCFYTTDLSPARSGSQGRGRRLESPLLSATLLVLPPR